MGKLLEKLLPGDDSDGKKNPFLEGAKRVAAIPARAVQLPVQIIHGALNTQSARNHRMAGEVQRSLSQQVTGSAPEYSEGREWANMLSLGLIPGNESAAVDPRTLSQDQSKKFGELNSLQQALLQAKRPQDFADLMGNDDLFAEPEPVKLEQYSAGAAAVDPTTGEIVNQVPFAPRALGPDQTLVSPDGQELGRNTPPVPSFNDRVEPKDLLPDYTTKSISRYNQSGDVADLELDTTKLDKQLAADVQKARIAASKPGSAAAPGSGLLDVGRVHGPFMRAAAPYVKKADRIRNFVGMFAMDPNKMPGDVRDDLMRMGIDPGAIQPNAIRDVSMVVGYLKAMEPDSVARESEQAVVAAARRLRLPTEAIRALFTGQPLLDEQRAQLFQAARDSFLSEIRGYDAMRGNYIKMSEMYLEGHDPEIVVPDNMSDLRDFINGGMGGVVSPMDEGGEVAQDAGAAIDQAYDDFVSGGGNPDDEQGFRAYIQKLGAE